MFEPLLCRVRRSNNLLSVNGCLIWVKCARNVPPSRFQPFYFMLIQDIEPNKIYIVINPSIPTPVWKSGILIKKNLNSMFLLDDNVEFLDREIREHINRISSVSKPSYFGSNNGSIVVEATKLHYLFYVDV